METLIQVKTGAADYAYKIQGLIAEKPDLHFAFSAEIYDRIAASAPDRMTKLNPDYRLVEGTNDGLSTLTDNLGIDIPDGIGDLLPYAGGIIAGARLIHSVITTEKQFKAADRSTKNKIQVVQTLTIFSRMGINTVLAMVGGAAGTAAGSAVPLVGNLVGGIAGSVAGAGMGMYLNQHLQPHMLDLALDITGLEQDDLFYYKNKERIDVLALSFPEHGPGIALTVSQMETATKTTSRQINHWAPDDTHRSRTFSLNTDDRLVHSCSAPWPNIPPPLTDPMLGRSEAACLERRL